MLWIILEKRGEAKILHKCKKLAEAIEFVGNYKGIWTPIDPTLEHEIMKITICVVVPCVEIHVIPIKTYEFIGLK